MANATVQFMLRLPPELATRIKVEAAGRGLSQNGLIAQVLDEQLGAIKVTS